MNDGFMLIEAFKINLLILGFRCFRCVLKGSDSCQCVSSISQKRSNLFTRLVNVNFMPIISVILNGNILIFSISIITLFIYLECCEYVGIYTWGQSTTGRSQFFLTTGALGTTLRLSHWSSWRSTANFNV